MSTHSVEIVSDFVAGGYSADCSCGWSSERYHTTAEALAASEMHRTIGCVTCGHHGSEDNELILDDEGDVFCEECWNP